VTQMCKKNAFGWSS